MPPSFFQIYLVIILFLPFLVLSQENVPEEVPVPKNISNYLLWGTYKPQLISAITQKSVYPITLGLAFSDFWKEIPSQDEFKNSLRFRMKRDTFAQYSHHNGLDFAIQHIEDPKLGVSFDITFLEEFYEPSNRSNDQSIETEWIYMIESLNLDERSNELVKTKGFNSFVYLGLGDLEGEDKDKSYVKIIKIDEDDSTLLEILNRENNKTQGYLRISVIDQNSNVINTNIREILNCAVQVNKTETWKVEDIIYSHLTENTLQEVAYLDPEKCLNFENSNTTFFLKQIIGTPNLRILMSFNSKDHPEKYNKEKIQKKIKEKKESFEKEFQNKFPIVNVNRFKINITEALDISRYSLSNLLGGIQYSYGKIRVVQAEKKEPQNKELFTATPSRVGFPRGFLWDEGFHQSLICEWNTTLCITMMRTWFDSIQGNGWIPREQARGDELESNFMQKEFLYQSQEEANPPSMILPILKLLNKLYQRKIDIQDSFEVFQFLREIYPKLRLWFYWFSTTQQNTNPLDGCESFLCFRWMCKSPCTGKYFASGLDDYPRHPPGYHAVAQVDLHVWLETFARGIIGIEKTLGIPTDHMEKTHMAILRSIESFADPTDNLVKDIIGLANSKGESTKKYRLVNLGYVNLFPLAFGLERNPQRLESVIQLIASRESLWSDFGVRSLSKSDPFFQKGDNYWTEPIWIPVNYLLLKGFKTFYHDDENLAELYKALRENLMENIAKTWKETHNFWEQYDSFTGKGKGFSSFTGWTSLISLIYSEKYD